MRFMLNIDMRNVAMRSDEDVAAAIHEVARKVEESSQSGIVRDANGNTVGSYEVAHEPWPPHISLTYACPECGGEVDLREADAL